LAADLVRVNVDVIFAPSSTMVEPARRATSTIPIVFATHADPVEVGHVESLAGPGLNITGLSMLLTDLVAKELEILTEVVPHAKRIAVLWNPTTPSHPPAMKAVEAAGQRLGLQLVNVPVQTVEEFDGGVRDDDTRARRSPSGGGVTAVPGPSRAAGRARTEAPAAGDVRVQGERAGGRSHQLRRRPHRPESARRCLHRQGPERRQAGRSARGAGIQVRDGDQPENRQGDRPRDPGIIPGP